MVDVQPLFDGIPDPCLVLGPDLTVIAVSDGYLRTTAMTREAVVGRNVFEAFPAIMEAASKERDADVKRLRAQLSEAEKELESFSFSVSHDLRAPLRSIQGFSQIALDEYSSLLPEDGREYLRRVCTSARRMSGLIDDLLTLSRIGRTELKREAVNVTSLARSVWRTLESAESHPVQFTVPDGLVVDADRKLLRLVIESLLGNARKFTAKVASPSVELGRRIVGGEAVFFVRDNGAGFDQAYVGRLFAPFQRLHADSDFPGSGIGLATVHRVIRRHGGRVWAEGAVGAGATVSFTVPAAPSVR
jgi:signal transduction histidine kinase